MKQFMKYFMAILVSLGFLTSVPALAGGDGEDMTVAPAVESGDDGSAKDGDEAKDDGEDGEKDDDEGEGEDKSAGDPPEDPEGS